MIGVILYQWAGTKICLMLRTTQSQYGRERMPSLYAAKVNTSQRQYIYTEIKKNYMNMDLGKVT